MQRDVVASPRVFGLLVSPDLKAAIIKGTLNEGALDYGKIFEELQAIRGKEAAPGVRIHATGNPVLVGWVDSYSAQILQIFLYTVFIVLAILIVYTRRLYGILLPLLGMALTSIWGVGFMGVLGYNLDPLMLVVPFLISARALSHGIQKVERYFLELARTDDKGIPTAPHSVQVELTTARMERDLLALCPSLNCQLMSIRSFEGAWPPAAWSSSA